MTAAGIDRAGLAEIASQEIARRRLYDFVLRYGLAPARHTAHLCGLLERIERGELARVIVTAPPGHGKSTLVNLWAARLTAVTPQRNLLLLSASENLAIRNSRTVRGAIQSEKWPFPSVRLSTDATATTAWETAAGTSVRAFGAGSTVTGFRGAVICDDVQADFSTPQLLDNLEEWFRGVLTTRIENIGGFALIVQTRWGSNDIIARLLEGESGDQWTYVNLEAICDSPGDPLGREIGEALWPARWPAEVLAKRRAEVGTVTWEASFQGHPQPEGGRIFAPAWFSRRYREAPTLRRHVPTERLPFFGTGAFWEAPRPEPGWTISGIDCRLWDPKEHATGSYSAIVTIRSDGPDFYVLESERARVTYDEFFALLQAHLRRHNTTVCAIEDVGQGARAIGEMRANASVAIVPMRPLGSKESRAMAITFLCEGGRVLFPERAGWLDAFERELYGFPSSRFNDQVDAFTWALTLGRSYVERETRWERRAESLQGWMGR